jgi:hypothetical protein
MMAWFLLIAALMVFLLLVIALTPLFNAIIGIMPVFNTATDLLLAGLFFIMLIVFLAAIFKKFTKDLNSESF